VVTAGEVDQLRQERAGARFRIVLGGDAGWLRDLRDVSVLDIDGPRALVELPGLDHDQALLGQALRRGPVHEFSRVVPALAEIYREVAR
jgi:ABC-2 type transport system ATP-binding protein